jgi:hypothetical protein
MVGIEEMPVETINSTPLQSFDPLLAELTCRSTTTKICKTVIEHIDPQSGVVVSTCKCEPTTYGQSLQIFAGLILFLAIFNLGMILDCATHTFKDKDRKTKWLILLLLLGLIFSIPYYFMVKRKNNY